MLCLAAWEVVWGQRPHAEKDEVDAPALARWLGFAPEEENAEKKRRKNKKNKEKGAGGLNIHTGMDGVIQSGERKRRRRGRLCREEEEKFSIILPDTSVNSLL